MTKVPEDSLDPQDPEVYRVSQDNLDLKVIPVMVVLWDLLDKLDPVDLLDHKALMDHKDLLVAPDSLVWLEIRVNKDRSVALDLQEHPVSRDLKEKMVKRVNVVFKDPKVLPELEEQSVKMDLRDILDLLDSPVTLVLLDLPVKLVTMETLVKMVILVIKVKLDHQDPWENKVLLDLLEREVKLDPPDLSDVKERREPRAKPVSAELLEALAPSEQLVNLESKVSLDYRDCLDLLESLVFLVAMVPMAQLVLWELKV